MQVMDDGAVVWSASDLTAASECEYGVLRVLDARLGRIGALAADDDPLLAQIARLGDRHEASVLLGLRRAGRSVTVLGRAEGTTRADLLAVQARTLAAFDEKPDVVFQAGFFDGSFLGYADFVERAGDAWLVSDAKLARQARPKALLQVAAYAEQLEQAGLPVAPEAALELGSGERETFALADVLPVFRERRARLLAMVAEHRADDAALEFGDPRFASCGRCPECAAAIAAREDLLLVAGVRVDQRLKFRELGLRTVRDLAAAGAQARPAGMTESTFAKLVAQARLQQRQLDAGLDESGRPNEVFTEPAPAAAEVLATLPAPSAGDVFFDFEGDPLYAERDLTLWGLEYLWGVLEVDGTFRPWWADDRDGERAALAGFMTYLLDRLSTYPDLHVYHYANYERSALLRLARRYHLFEEELDDLLRAGVLVDLYATVRGAVRISQPSYSIKKLEPLYMDTRSGSDVTAGDASIVAFHEYRDHLDRGEPAEAQARRESITEYNRLDCVSTRLLRDWLLEQPDAPRFSTPVTAQATVEPLDVGTAPADEVFARLMEHAGPGPRGARSASQQAFALLAEARGYYRRENAPFWWDHFDRLRLPVEEWGHPRDVFQVLGAEVVEDWNVPPRKKNHFRRVRLTGEWSPGSTPKNQAFGVYALPVPDGVEVPEGGVLGAAPGVEVTLGADESRVEILESARGGVLRSAFPVALTPDAPPPPTTIESAIALVSGEAAGGELPARAAVDVLLRRPPRLHSGAALPRTGDVIADAVTALTAMDDSYVAVQGPPGTGKSYTGARVVQRLVEEHGWRVGVVAQSHAVVEHLLDGVLDAGLDPERVGKIKPENPGRWADLDNEGARKFIDSGGGRVVGGTAWAFCNKHLADADLDLLVVDEAGQFALAPTIGASAGSRRLLLLGDPQQLPQVSKGVHAEPVGDSALGWLMDGHDTMPPELGYFLPDTYRMHPALCARVSALSYEGRLSAHPCTSERRLDGVDPGLLVVRLDHTQRGSESPEEADEVVRQVRRLLGTPWTDPRVSPSPRPLEARDFLVVAPYNAQVNLIRNRLAAAGFGAVQVGTVDKFQGRQAPVTLISMTASSQGDVPRGMGFLLDRNRVNVAASRAQWLTVLIRSSALTAYMPHSTEQLLELGAFINLSTS